MLPVPRQHYRAVLSYLARLMDGEAAHEPPGATSWSVEQVARLARQPLNSTIKAMLDLTASSPDTRFCLADIQTRAGTEYGQARGHLAAFTKLLRKHFDLEEWPIRVEQGADGKLYYHASPLFAECWTAAAASADQPHQKGGES